MAMKGQILAFRVLWHSLEGHEHESSSLTTFEVKK